MSAMLFQVACVFLISKASVDDYGDLVTDVEYTLNECLGIIEDADRYMVEVHVLQGVSRRATDENDNHATDVKLSACTSMIEAMNTYHEKHIRLALYQELLKLDEKAYLYELLKPLSKKMGDLLYVASTDGDDASDFKNACGKKGPTLLIIESTNGTVFGGYTDGDWSSNKWHSSSTAFLFRLRPSFKQYGIIDTQHASYGGSSDCIYLGHALNLCDHPLSSTTSNVQGGYYNVTGHELNDGERNFRAREYVAVKVVDL